jgi:predicted ATPase
LGRAGSASPGWRWRWASGCGTGSARAPCSCRWRRSPIPGLVLAAIGRAAGADLTGTGAPTEALAETFGDGAWLLVLDNLEQVVQVAPDLGELLARCPGLAMLATSRAALGLRAEREYPVPPLPLPAGSGAASVAEVAASPAVALFVDRARAARPGFALTEGNAGAVAEICRRLEGLPLAIELAAARTRLLDPPALLDRLVSSLNALGTGAVDLPERQRTLRATVQWSVDLLDGPERSLLEVAAVFTDGWTIPAVAQVAGLDEDRALELSEALARHSLIYLDSTELGPRSRMLETVREFVAERLAARPDTAEVGRRHAGRELRRPRQAAVPPSRPELHDVRLRPVVARRRPSPRHGHPRPAQQRHDALRRCLARGEGRCVQALDRIRIPVVDALSRRTEGVMRVMRLQGPVVSSFRLTPANRPSD